MEHPGPFLISLNIADCLVLPGEFFPSLSFPGLFYCQIRRTLPGTYLAPMWMTQKDWQPTYPRRWSYSYARNADC